jgi:hypothetical protein
MSYRQCLRGFLKVCGSAVILGSIVLGSCAPQHKDSILFGTNTTAGLKVGVDERQVPIAILGYNRQEAALVPLFVYGDGMFKAADRNVEGTTYLQLAKERFEKAEAAGDQDPKRQALFDEGVRFVSMAYDTTLRKSANGAKVSEASPILERLNGLAGKPDLQNVTLCKLLAEAEIQRPSTAIRYLEEYKYIGDCDGQKYKDAYSVLGTFTGSAKGAATPTGSNALEATGSIAQYFATGVAAQNLSRTPASVSGNASAIKAAADAIVIQDVRGAEFVEENRQERVKRIADAIDKLDDASAIKLVQTPPVQDPQVQKVVEARDPQNLRFKDGKAAREILKMMVGLGPRSDADLDRWEVAVGMK